MDYNFLLLLEITNLGFHDNSSIIINTYISESTALEQVVACALVTQRAQVRSPVGTGFLGEVFFGVFPHP